MVAARSEPVFEDERGDAVGGEPFRIPLPFVPSQPAIAAAGADDDRSARGDGGISQERRQSRNIFRLGPQSTRRAFGPEREWSFLLQHNGISGLRGGAHGKENAHQQGEEREVFHRVVVIVTKHWARSQ